MWGLADTDKHEKGLPPLFFKNLIACPYNLLAVLVFRNGTWRILKLLMVSGSDTRLFNLACQSQRVIVITQWVLEQN